LHVFVFYFGFRNDPKGAMYSDYFDAPDDLSGAMRDDGKDCDDNMDDIETDEGSSDNEETAVNKFHISEDDNNGDDDDDPKSTLEKQQEKVGRGWIFWWGGGGGGESALPSLVKEGVGGACYFNPSSDQCAVGPDAPYFIILIGLVPDDFTLTV
jgi:hypothetical protein